ncbi:MAG: hypothetical protein J1F17_02030 [Oscillospiraceae bacterium]|nr:hypothetical protein [Oscillospiraceae bacterium]
MANRRYSDRQRSSNTYSDDFYIGMSYEYGQLSSDRRRRERARKLAAKRRRTKNRIKLIALGVVTLVIVISLVVGICSGIKSCVSDDSGFKTAKVSADASKKAKSNVAGKANSEEALQFVKVQIEDNNKKGMFSSQNGAVYLWNKSAYEIFGASADRSDMYAEVINKATKHLGDDIKVYAAMIPLHAEMNLPERLKAEAGCSSQADNIYNAYSKFDKAQPINIYNVLAEHNKEYLYFNSDHHWTGLGAYYAYTAFCEQTNQKPMTISEEGTHSVEGFTGSFHTYGTGLKDTVNYYDLPYDTSCTLYSDPASDGQPADVYYANPEAGENTYGVFINGDQPKFIIDSACESGKKIAVIKESFGNAFVPYLSANYSEVHVLDMRYCGITNLKKYCEDNEIKEVMFINNIMSANSAERIEDIEKIIGR